VNLNGELFQQTSLSQTVIQQRRPLANTWRRLKEGNLTIGFIGGSITDARPRHNWPEPVIAWFADRFPDARIIVENAAIGATGSDLAVFRAERELIGRGCDLVFVDFAVNDNGEASEKRMRTREGLTRKLLKGQSRDIVYVYTYCQEMYESMLQGGIPDTIQEFEQLGEHYGISSVWMGLYALNEVKRGALRWEEWLPDGLHPQSRGSYAYAQSVIAFLEQDRLREMPSGLTASVVPAALNANNWEISLNIPLGNVRVKGPWVIRRWPYSGYIEQVLETASVGAELAFSFDGRGLALAFDFGKTSAEFTYRLDQGDWIAVVRDRPDWCGDDGWYRMETISDSLEQGKHEIEVRVVHGDRPDCRGSNFRLALIGIIK